ncbi:MAG: GGDEF domain-containing protein [Lachnospiraceae bacterium]|nr:GGDEF domain-containing protein [Lachnospiraceae bacterium]
MKKNRKRIGLLISEYYDSFAREVCIGAMRAAEDLDQDMFIFSGGYLKSTYVDASKNAYEYQNNFLYEFVNEQNVDCVAVLLGTIASHVDEEEKLAFLKRFDSVPIISIADKAPGYASIAFNNIGGFKKEVEYVIDTLGKKEIGIVCGPDTNADAIARLEAYKEVMRAHDLPILEERIVYGNFSEYCDTVVEGLLDANPGLEAIVFCNDHMALGGYRVFEKRGLRPGQDIVVVGFDDAPFAALMNPRLTTTKADAAELGYRSIKELLKIEKNEEKEILVDTTLVVRESCGGNKLTGFVNTAEKYEYTLHSAKAIPKLTDHITEGLFHNHTDIGGLSIVRENVERLVRFYDRRICDGKPVKDKIPMLIDEYRMIIVEILPITTQRQLLFDLAEFLTILFSRYVSTDEDRNELYLALSECFKSISVEVERCRNNEGREGNILNWIMMDITRDILSEDMSRIRMHILLRKMEMLGIHSSSIIALKKPIQCATVGDWKMPKQMYVRAIQVGSEAVTPPKNQQKVDVSNFFSNSNLDSNRRRTMAVSCLFSGREQYGLFVAEPNYDNLTALEPLRFQISSALQTISLVEQKEEIADKLEENLQELKETNAFLDEVSKSDELTEVYNRRGFLVTAKKLIRAKENQGRIAMFGYADMNNLKLVNDQFGHEEGDNSLRMVASILKESMGKDAIIGRLGGDEFGVFVLLKNMEEEKEIRARVRDETGRQNGESEKPYYVSMSIGSHAFPITADTNLDDMMAIADDDLYVQKQSKRTSIWK